MKKRLVWSVLIAVEGVKTTNLATIVNGTCLRGCEYRVTGVRTVHVKGLLKSKKSFYRRI